MYSRSLGGVPTPSACPESLAAVADLGVRDPS
jgi:hypothetical protein